MPSFVPDLPEDLIVESLRRSPGNEINSGKFDGPSTNLAGGGFLVAFASSKNRVEPGALLHTNFKLDSPGEFLALVEPDGVTVASQFAPRYPAQFADVSYGFGMDIRATVLVATNGPCRAWVPTDGSLGSAWTQIDFNDATWLSGPGGAGYDTGLKDPAEDTWAGRIAEANPLAYWRFSETNGPTAINSGILARSPALNSVRASRN